MITPKSRFVSRYRKTGFESSYDRSMLLAFERWGHAWCWAPRRDWYQFLVSSRLFSYVWRIEFQISLIGSDHFLNREFWCCRRAGSSWMVGRAMSSVFFLSSGRLVHKQTSWQVDLSNSDVWDLEAQTVDRVIFCKSGIGGDWLMRMTRLFMIKLLN